MDTYRQNNSASKLILVFLALLLFAGANQAQIIADHTVVDRYADIPQRYIDEVKKMLVDIGGESHSLGYQNGVNLLEFLDTRFQVLTYTTNPPPPDSEIELRLGRPYLYGESLWTSQGGIDDFNETMLDQNNTGNPYDVFAFGWCWDMTWENLPGGGEDPEFGVRWAGTTEGGIAGSIRWGLDAGDEILTGNPVCMDNYLDAIEQFNAFNAVNGIPTKAIFATGPVDSYYDENAFQRELKHDYIRTYVLSHPGSILFDYADILCWNNNGEKHTEIWDDEGVMRSYAQIHPDNLYDYDAAWGLIPFNDDDGDHIGEAGALRIAKAMWWLLARIAGWDGYPETEWTGAAGNDWDNAGNWGVGVPDLNTSVFIPAMAVGPVISAGTEAECRNMTIADGAVLTIESTANSSGSLIVYGSSLGTVIYNRRMPDDALYHYVSSPLQTSLLPGSSIFWAWNEPAGDWGDPVTANIAGAGYTIQANNSTVPFAGSVITETVTVPATSPYADCDFPFGLTDDYSERQYAQDRDAYAGYGGGGWNLLGNPFTSALDAAAFISSNDQAFDQNYRALYIYNGNTYSYTGTELTGWENVEDSFGFTNIQAGQGFFVAARCNSSQFVFTPQMQVHNTAVPYTKSAVDNQRWPGLLLKAVSGSGEASTLVVYNEQMSTRVDPGCDIGQMNSADGISIYTLLASPPGGVNYVRQALPTGGADTLAVPLGIDLREGGTVTFSAVTSPLGSLRYWLEDRVTGTFTELNTKSYTVTLPADTYGSGRFYIIASANTPTSINQPAEPGDNLRIWASGRRVILSGAVSEGSLCELFDISGRKLLQEYLADGGMNFVELPAGVNGVIVVRVTDGGIVVTRKVVVT